MSQKALILSTIGEPLHIVERPIPIPKENEVLVKISIASVNPHDAKSKSIGLFVKDILPTPLAVEYVGKVTKLGPEVTKFSVGDVIYGFGDVFNADEMGTQEYALLTITQAAKVPKNVNLDEALTFPLNAQTSYYALFHSTGLGLPQPIHGQFEFDYAAHSIVIIGGGAATGKFAIELSRMAGFGNIITIASKSNESALKKLGATHVIDRKLSPDEANSAIRAITGDNLLHVIDVVNYGTDQTLGVRFLSSTQKGIMVTIIASGEIDESQIGEKKAGYERRFVFCNPKGYTDCSIPFWENLTPWVEAGKLQPTKYSVIQGLDADKINEALDTYNSDGGYGLGRVVKPHIHLE